MSNHARRVLRIVSMLSSGRAMTTHDIRERLKDEQIIGDISLRQIQRDLRDIEDANIPLQTHREHRAVYWRLLRH